MKMGKFVCRRDNIEHQVRCKQDLKYRAGRQMLFQEEALSRYQHKVGRERREVERDGEKGEKSGREGRERETDDVSSYYIHHMIFPFILWFARHIIAISGESLKTNTIFR